MKLFIDDGYNLPGYLKPEPGLHPELVFSYRPCLHEERAAYWDWESRHESLQLDADRATAAGLKSFAVDPLAKTRKRAELVHTHLVSWEAGVPLSAEWIRKLHPNLLDRLVRVILGVDPPDTSPPDPLSEAARGSSFNPQPQAREAGARDDAKN